jgi:hypothetical protein
MYDAVIEHMMPGRIRLRFRSQRGDVAFFEQLVQLLSTHAIVAEVRANPLTGSVLIRHSASPEELARLAEQTGLVDPRTAVQPRRPNQTGAKVARTGRPAVPLVSPAAALSVLGFLQLARGNLLGSAAEHFWHAYRLHQVQKSWIVPALIGLGLFQLLKGRALAPASSLFVYALLARAGAGRISQTSSP